MAELLALGLGYSVEPLTDLLLKEGWAVHGTTRDTAKAARFKRRGISPVIWESGQTLPTDIVGRADVIIVSIPPNEEGCPAALAMPPLSPHATCIYLSSSGVYGDHGGEWIDEDTPCTPSSGRGQRRLLAESQWRHIASSAGARLHLCRLAGIYGPGRNALESLKGGTNGAKAGLAQRVIKPGQVFNRIHRDDIARGLMPLLAAPEAPDIINFADDEPAPPQDVIAYAAELLGMPPPSEVPFVEAELSPMARSFYADNKRLKNDRLRALPGFRLRYPDYRSGLWALAAS